MPRCIVALSARNIYLSFDVYMACFREVCVRACVWHTRHDTIRLLHWPKTLQNPAQIVRYISIGVLCFVDAFRVTCKRIIFRIGTKTNISVCCSLSCSRCTCEPERSMCHTTLLTHCRSPLLKMSNKRNEKPKASHTSTPKSVSTYDRCIPTTDTGTYTMYTYTIHCAPWLHEVCYLFISECIEHFTRPFSLGGCHCPCYR